MAEEQVLAGDGAVGLGLADPVPVRRLGGQENVPGPADRVVDFGANGEGYVYTTASSPGTCHPPQWTVYDSEDVGGNWYFVTLKSAGAQ